MKNLIKIIILFAFLVLSKQAFAIDNVVLDDGTVIHSESIAVGKKHIDFWLTSKGTKMRTRYFYADNSMCVLKVKTKNKTKNIKKDKICVQFEDDYSMRNTLEYLKYNVNGEVAYNTGRTFYWLNNFFQNLFWFASDLYFTFFY